MAIHGKNSAVTIGAYDPTKFLTDYTIANAADTAETTGFQMQAKEYTVGQSDATVTFSGRYQGSKSNVEAVFERIQDNADGDPFFVGQSGWVPGSRCRYGIVLRTGYDVSASVGDVVSTSVNLQATGGVNVGWSLGRGPIGTGAYPWNIVDTNDDGLTRWTSSDAILTVLNNSLSADGTFVFQHSPDGTTWADIPDLSFAIQAGKNTAVLRTSTTVLARYVRAQVYVPNGTTGSAEIVPAIGRN